MNQGTLALICATIAACFGLLSAQNMPIATGAPTEDQLSNGEYYSWRVVYGKESQDLWFDRNGQEKKHDTLSNSYRTGMTLKLSSSVRFYGYNLTEVVISVGGFVYLSNFIHQWLSASQYVAPLMANFDTTIGNDSNIYYLQRGNSLIVWWENIYLKDGVKGKSGGHFTFQAIMYTNGTFVFNYNTIGASSLFDISESHHPVKVGISDAYYVDTVESGVTRRKIIEYNTVSIDFNLIKNTSTVILTPKPTCNLFDDCASCVNSKTSFDCGWCPDLNICSNGIDRMKQNWQNGSCDSKSVHSEMQCMATPTTTSTAATTTIQTSKPCHDKRDCYDVQRLLLNARTGAMVSVTSDVCAQLQNTFLSMENLVEDACYQNPSLCRVCRNLGSYLPSTPDLTVNCELVYAYSERQIVVDIWFTMDSKMQHRLCGESGDDYISVSSIMPEVLKQANVYSPSWKIENWYGTFHSSASSASRTKLNLMLLTLIAYMLCLE